MAKKKETTSLIEALLEYQELKSIDRNTLIAVMEDSLRNVLSKMFGSDDTFDVIINVEKKGDFEIWRTRHVVADEDFVDEVREVPLSEAQRFDSEISVGEDFVDAVDFNSFGRRAVINLRQALASKILELQKEHFYHSFVGRVGELISAEVYQVWKREALLIDDEGNELLMPKTEQIPGDFFRKGETVRAVIERVENENSNPKVILSRVSRRFLERLLEQNVPEIADGLITIRAAARIPGERAKIAVESYDDRIDPVGACVGVNGSRIRSIVREELAAVQMTAAEPQRPAPEKKDRLIGREEIARRLDITPDVVTAKMGRGELIWTIDPTGGERKMKESWLDDHIAKMPAYRGLRSARKEAVA